MMTSTSSRGQTLRMNLISSTLEIQASHFLISMTLLQFPFKVLTKLRMTTYTQVSTILTVKVCFNIKLS